MVTEIETCEQRRAVHPLPVCPDWVDTRGVLHWAKLIGGGGGQTVLFFSSSSLFFQRDQTKIASRYEVGSLFKNLMC